MNTARAVAVSTAALASAARAHTGGGSHFAWTFDAGVIVPLALALLLFLVGLARVRLRARTMPSASALRFLAGWSVLAGALVSPLHAVGEHSFAAHMLEHELLMLVAAPLLVGAHANGILLWSLPQPARTAVSHFFLAPPVASVWRRLVEPVPATLLQAAALWLWHMPALFDAALSSPAWHIAQHLSFLVAALLFWSAMFDAHRHHKPMLAIGGLFATAIVSGALGALMALSTSPWYAFYRASQPELLDMSPTQDQQIAGLLMWIPGGLVHTAVALWMLARLVKRLSRTPPPA